MSTRFIQAKRGAARSKAEHSLQVERARNRRSRDSLKFKNLGVLRGDDWRAFVQELSAEKALAKLYINTTGDGVRTPAAAKSGAA